MPKLPFSSISPLKIEGFHFGNFFISLKRFLIKIKLKLQTQLINKIANDFAKGVFNNNIYELFLPNNKIFSRKYLLLSTGKVKIQTSSIDTRKFFKNDEVFQTLVGHQNKSINFNKVKNDLNIVIICSRRFGEYYASYDWINFEKYLKRHNIKIYWPENYEFFDEKMLLHKILNFFSNSESQLIFIEPLASFEVFKEFKIIDVDFIRNIRRVFSNLRVVAQLGDLSRAKDLKQIQSINNFVDLFIHFDQIKAFQYPQEILLKMFFYPFFKLGFEGFRPDHNKSNSVFFSGQIRDSDRRFWIRETTKITTALGLKFNVATWGSVSSPARLSEKLYKKNLNASLSTLSLTQKGLNHWIIPGRAIQSIASHSLLLQQEGQNCRPLSQFLQPYSDYLPFTNYSELLENLIFISKNMDRISQITKSANQKLELAYSPEYFWNKVLSQL